MANVGGYTPGLLQPVAEPAGGVLFDAPAGQAQLTEDAGTFSLWATVGLDPVLSPPSCPDAGGAIVRDIPRLVRSLP